MAMSIGKFNFKALRDADEMAAWIFFVFSVVVNMILINMMIAIINIAFEDIKSNQVGLFSGLKLCEQLCWVSCHQPLVPGRCNTEASSP